MNNLIILIGIAVHFSNIILVQPRALYSRMTKA